MTVSKADILIFVEMKLIIICHHIILFICTGEISKLYRVYPFMYFQFYPIKLDKQINFLMHIFQPMCNLHYLLNLLFSHL